MVTQTERFLAGPEIEPFVRTYDQINETPSVVSLSNLSLAGSEIERPKEIQPHLGNNIVPTKVNNN